MSNSTVPRDTEPRDTEQEKLTRVLSIVNEFLSKAVSTRNSNDVFRMLLGRILELTESEFGFIGEVLYDGEFPYLKTHAISNIAWDEETLRFYRAHAPNGFEFRNLKTLFGFTLTTGQSIISNDPATDPNSGGLPIGHPELHSYAGLPIYLGTKMIGMVGLGNRQHGYSYELLELLMPISHAVAHVVDSIRADKIREELDAERRVSNALMESQLQQTQDGIFVFGEHRTILSYNDQFLSLWGLSGIAIDHFSSSQVIEKMVEHTLDEQEFVRQFSSLDTAGNTCIRSQTALKDGRTLAWHCAPVFVDEDQCIGRACYFRDITPQLRVQRVLSDAKNQAEAANQSKSEFLANMSHEIRTPMTAILGFTDILIEEVETTSHLENLQVVKRNGEFLLEILNDILDLSKIESGRLEVESVQCDLRQLAGEIIQLMGPRVTGKPIELRLKIEESVPSEAWTDPTRLRQILFNLIGNAVKFTEAGHVELRVKSVVNESGTPLAQFTVSDSGIGMSPEQMSKIFTPFTQADTSTTRKFGGTGLGLSISRRLSELLGGELNVESELGVGSSFHVTVSTSPSDSASSQRETVRPKRVVEVRQHTTQLLKGSRILLAEDGVDNQRIISHILRKAGADVTIVDNGQLAVESALEHDTGGTPFDVILMDMQMPVLDGLKATARLRDQGYERPIIALTANAMVDARNTCLQAGCNDFSTKPINREHLFDVLTTWIVKGTGQF